MKNLFYLNVYAFFIMLVMFSTIFIGLLLMIPVGAIQLITSLYLLYGVKTYSDKWKPYLQTHLLLSIVTLLVFFSPFALDSNDELFYTAMVAGGGLSIYFIIILYLIYREQQRQLPVQL